MSSNINDDALNGSIIHSTINCLSRVEYSMSIMPKLLKDILIHHRWKRFVVETTGELVEYDSFESLVRTSTPRGFGTTVQTLQDLCCRDMAVRTLIDAACVEAGFRKKHGNVESAKKVVQKMTHEEFQEFKQWLDSYIK